MNKLLGFFLLLFIVACSPANQKQVDTPTNGRIKVGIDESFRLFADAEIYAFESIYKQAFIDTLYKNEADVINDFLNDSVPLIMVSRKLTDDQVKYLNDRQFVPKTTRIAHDAIALIVNKENPDTTLFYQTVKEIFEGKITTWKQINPKSKLTELKVVFDNFKSCNPRYFKEKFAINNFPATCFAAQNNAEVIRYVESHKNGIGIVSVNWISDKADSVSNNFLQRIKVVGIAIEGDNDPNTKFYKPYQAYIADQSYPFTREVYCINRQPYTGMAYGFSSFIAGEKGQLIALHSGLVPATMPVRIVEIKH
ncbi:MAG: substrate-binding domain-containing protein [Bacteroidales bacterium]|nr:substrate-binding domain-containing protein [Bacteroidales bacterium]MDD4603179.1 substrate-binding domain-containing protein [Bacteroidales bacterium]